MQGSKEFRLAFNVIILSGPLLTTLLELITTEWNKTALMYGILRCWFELMNIFSTTFVFVTEYQ